MNDFEPQPEDFNEYVIDVFALAVILFEAAPRSERMGSGGYVISDFNELDAQYQEPFFESARKAIKYHGLLNVEDY